LFLKYITINYTILLYYPALCYSASLTCCDVPQLFQRCINNIVWQASSSVWLLVPDFFYPQCIAVVGVAPLYTKRTVVRQHLNF